MELEMVRNKKPEKADFLLQKAERGIGNNVLDPVFLGSARAHFAEDE